MSDLLSHVPRTATRHCDGRLVDVPLDEIAPGDRLLIRQGDIVPVDGTIESLSAFLDTSALTGESLPVKLAVFAAAFALVSTVSAALSNRFGESGLFATTAVSGAFDVDVAVLSSLRLAEGGIAAALVAQTVLVALATNAVGRLVLAIVAGPARFSLPLAAITASAAAVAGAAFVWLSFA